VCFWWTWLVFMCGNFRFCRVLAECWRSAAFVIRTMSWKLYSLRFFLVLCVIDICLPVGLVETRTRGCSTGSCLRRTRRDSSSATRVFVVHLSDSGELFTVGTVPPDADDCFQFDDTPPPGLILDTSTGMISKDSSVQWDSPTTIPFTVSRCAGSASGIEFRIVSNTNNKYWNTFCNTWLSTLLKKTWNTFCYTFLQCFLLSKSTIMIRSLFSAITTNWQVGHSYVTVQWIIANVF